MAAQPVETQVYFQEPVAVIRLIGQMDRFSEKHPGSFLTAWR